MGEENDDGDKNNREDKGNREDKEGGKGKEDNGREGVYRGEGGDAYWGEDSVAEGGESDDV